MIDFHKESALTKTKHGFMPNIGEPPVVIGNNVDVVFSDATCPNTPIDRWYWTQNLALGCEILYWRPHYSPDNLMQVGQMYAYRDTESESDRAFRCECVSLRWDDDYGWVAKCLVRTSIDLETAHDSFDVYQHGEPIDDSRVVYATWDDHVASLGDEVAGPEPVPEVDPTYFSTFPTEVNPCKEIELPDDPVNSPSHYNQGDIECIEAIKAALTPEEFRGWLRGNIIKYNWRCNDKGSFLQDLGKAEYYLKRLIKEASDG